MEARVPIIPDEDEINEDSDESTVTREHVRKQGTKIVELARSHAFGEFDSDRADNRIYEDEQILDLFASACLTQGSAHSEGKAGWFLDEAHLFAPSGHSEPSTDPLVEWVRQGRRPGLSLVMATQQPGALDNPILSQCDTLIIHRLTAGQDSDAVGDKIPELHDAQTISHYMQQILKDPGYAYAMNDDAETIVPVKVRTRKSWHAAESAKLEEFLDSGDPRLSVLQSSPVIDCFTRWRAKATIPVNSVSRSAVASG